MSAPVASITLRGRTVTREAVLAAMDEHDQLGPAAFLARHGYREAGRYWLRGPSTARRYPSKAILGVAAGLDAADFFGGLAHTVSALRRLGFEVREGDEPEAPVGLDALRRAAVEAGFDDPAPDWDTLPVTPAAVFASGSNRVGEIKGMGLVGMDVGVAAPHVSATSEAALVQLAGTDVQVFCDSGAFSEVEWSETEQRLVPTRPITDGQWRERLALYARLAAQLGDQAWLVAPDQVGSQEVTLERLRRYAPELRALAETGARILVVAQKGAKSQAAFYAEAVAAADLVGFPNVVPALPCKKAATTPAEVEAFLREARPAHVHLLGKGPRARDVRAYLAPFAAEGVEASVSLDACWITANAGTYKGKGGGANRYTKAQRFAGAVLAAAGRIAEATSRAAADVVLRLQLALLLCLGHPLPAGGEPALEVA